MEGQFSWILKWSDICLIKNWHNSKKFAPIICSMNRLKSEGHLQKNSKKGQEISIKQDWKVFQSHSCAHRLRTPGEEIAFTARPKIYSHSQIFRYGRSIFCLPHRPKFSDFFDFCLHWVSVVRGCAERITIRQNGLHLL